MSFLLRLTVAADDGSERLVSTARTTETTYRFTQLALGNYRLTVRAVMRGDSRAIRHRYRSGLPHRQRRLGLS
ncbi:host specificity protein [Escherichia coli DEC4E]|nr:host specificity protein [Escherichia coli DEC4E]